MEGEQGMTTQDLILNLEAAGLDALQIEQYLAYGQAENTARSYSFCPVTGLPCWTGYTRWKNRLGVWTIWSTEFSAAPLTPTPVLEMEERHHETHPP